MLTLYLACLIFGGIFILVTLFFGSDGDIDFDTDLDIELGGEADFDLDAPEGEGLTAAIKFLSFRNVVFFLAFFGLTGTVLSWLNSPGIVTFLAALGLGLFSATLMHKVMQHLLQNEVGQTLELEDLIGSLAVVTVDLSKERRGKISLTAGGQRLQLLAQTAEEAERGVFHQGEEVLILRMAKGIAQVVEKEFITES